MKRVLLHIDTDQMDARSLRWAHEAGLEVVGTGASSEQLDHLYVDHFEVLGPDNLEGLLRIAQSHSAGQGEGNNNLAGVFSSKANQSMSLALLAEAFGLRNPSPAALERALDPEQLGLCLSAAKLRYVHLEQIPATARRFYAQAFFREGDFVRGGLLELCHRETGQPEFRVQGHLDNSLEDSFYALLENAARQLELSAGPLSASLISDECGLAITSISPCFDDVLMSSYLAPLALGKSPIQAWFACLALAGGPFDSMPHRPMRCAGSLALRVAGGGSLGTLDGLQRARACDGIEGVRALLQTGAELDSDPVVALIWGTGEDEHHLRSRLVDAAGRLTILREECSAA